MYNSSKHLFHYKWQAMQYEHFRMTIEGEVGLVMDLAKTSIIGNNLKPNLVTITKGSQLFFLLCASLNVICALH